MVASGIDVNQLIKKKKDENVNPPSSPEIRQSDSQPNYPRTQFVKDRSVSVLSTDSDASLTSPMDQPPPVIQEEEKAIGSVSSAVYAQYIKAGSGTFLMVAMIVSTLASQVIFQYTDYFLALW